MNKDKLKLVYNKFTSIYIVITHVINIYKINSFKHSAYTKVFIDVEER